MNDAARFQRLAAQVAILALPLALASDLALLAAMNFNPLLFLNPASLISIGPGGATWLRWGMILDVFGYYLPLAPLILHLWSSHRSHSPNFVNLYTACGLGYVLVGAMGASVLAAVLPPLIDQYAQALPAQREVLQVVFSGFMNAVYLGLWNPLEVLLLAIWFLGMGPLIARERPMLGIVAQVFGCFGLLDVIGRIVNVDIIFYVGVFGFLLYPFWLPWLGIALLKSRAPEPAATPKWKD